MAERDTTLVEVNLTRQRPYRVNDADREAVWVGPGLVTVPRWVAEAWGMPIKANTPPVLPIVNYDGLSVREILPLLDTLTDAQRQVIAKHEAANRNRKTILEALG